MRTGRRVPHDAQVGRHPPARKAAGAGQSSAAGGPPGDTLHRGPGRASVEVVPRVTFRFYASLNDFLPHERRTRRFVCDAEAHASVKDAIEAIGVPHPEVDVIVVNGTPVEFGWRLQEGDEVAVYPRFCAIEPGSHLAAPVPVPARFVTDVHLAKLTARLRLAGFDTVEADVDAELASRAEQETRIALTRDRELLKRRPVQIGYWIRQADPDEQFVEVLRYFDLARDVKPFTRCLRCNGVLQSASREAVADRLPPGVAPLFEDFHRCPSCGRVYWRGSHYDRLRTRLDRALARAGI
jgi:uncharacterized protein